MTTQTRAGLYLRVSTSAQGEDDKVSLPEQQRLCEAHAADRGLDVAQVYTDRASGVSRDRPAWVRMLAEAAAGRLTHIVAWDSARLSRSGSAMGDLLEACKKHGVTIETVSTTFDVTYAGLMAEIAAIERRNITARTMMGKTGTARAGRLPFGTVTYGYARAESGLPVIVEHEAQVVREMFRMYTHDQQGVPTIAKHLRGKWGFDRTLAGYYLMLRNPAYVGRMVYDGIEIPCPSIIDEVTFQRTQERLTKRRKSGRLTSETFYLLQGSMKCENCGSTMSCRTRREKFRTTRYYKCRKHAPSCRPTPYLRADDLEGRVWDEVVDVLRRPLPLDGQVQRHPGR